jgi:nondiscriminating glutamyl-tRNA synthetase
MLNYLTLLGWSSPDGAEKMSRKELIEKFSLDRVNPAPAVFDSQKLEWLNGQYIHEMSAQDLRPLVARFFDVPWLEEGIEVVKTSVHRLTQFKDALRFVTEYVPPADIDQNFARALLEELRAGYENLFDRLKAKTGLKGKALFQPLRLALTGVDHGPELVKILPLLDHASSVDPSVLSPVQRVEKCIR